MTLQEAKGCFRRIAFFVLSMLRPVELVFVDLPVVKGVLQFPRNVVVSFVEKANQPVDFVSGFFPLPSYGLEELLGRGVSWVVERASGVCGLSAGIVVLSWESASDIDQSSLLLVRPVGVLRTTSAGRLFFKQL